MAGIIPTCMALPPDSISIEGIMVSTSMKFWAIAIKPACQRKGKKLCFNISGDTDISYVIHMER